MENKNVKTFEQFNKIFIKYKKDKYKYKKDKYKKDNGDLNESNIVDKDWKNETKMKAIDFEKVKKGD